MIVDCLLEYNDGIIVENFLDFIDYVKNKDTFKIICRFHSDIDIKYLFLSLVEIKNCTLVVEEAEIYISAGARSSEFLDLCRYGRHYNVSILGIARRSAELSIDFRALCEKIISFKQTELNDIQKLNSVGLYDLENLEQFEYTDNCTVPLLDKHYKEIIL